MTDLLITNWINKLYKQDYVHLFVYTMKCSMIDVCVCVCAHIREYMHAVQNTRVHPLMRAQMIKGWQQRLWQEDNNDESSKVDSNKHEKDNEDDEGDNNNNNNDSNSNSNSNNT